MRAPTRTQLMIAQELERRKYVRRLTLQDEYLKFSLGAGENRHFLWVGRRGQLLQGRRLSTSWDYNNRSDWWREVRYCAKELYEEAAQADETTGWNAAAIHNAAEVKTIGHDLGYDDERIGADLDKCRNSGEVIQLLRKYTQRKRG